MSFRLLSYASVTGARAGLLVGDEILDLAAALHAHFRGRGDTPGFSGASVMGVLEAWDTAGPVLREIALARAEGSLVAPGLVAGRPEDDDRSADALEPLRLLAPVLYPGAVYCAAVNYTDHLREVAGKEPPDKAVTRPFFFLKPPVHTVIGPGEPIRLPPTSVKLDWEAELAVVIGRPAYRVSRDEAMACVAGYTIMNDLSARDQSKRTDWQFGTDWFRAKSFDTSAPMGPWITPADEVDNPHDLAIHLAVNGQVQQDSTSRCMHFQIPELIEYLSEQITLRPGDVIATGTPAGTGNRRGIYLKAGDEVRITIAGLGTLRNRVVEGAR